MTINSIVLQDCNAALAEKRERRERWLMKKRYKRSVHATLLEKHGLPNDMAHAAFLLDIPLGTLRQRIHRNPDDFLKPLRRYGQRSVSIPLNYPAAEQTLLHVT